MKLLRLQGENFRSFAKIDLDLNVDGLIAVVGPNGSGKSSLFGAVEWALFGGKRGAGALPVRRDGSPETEKCWAELEFESGGRIYRVRRIDGKKATLVDVASDQEIASTLTDTSRQAAAVLGLTQDMFCGTFYARQREVQALAESAKASERREQLEQLLGIKHLRHAAELAGRDAREQHLVYEALAADAPDVEVLKAELDRIEGEARQAAPAVKEATAKLQELRTAHRQATARVDQLAAQAQEYGRRRLAAREADGELSREQVVLDNLRTQLETAMNALAQLSELEPVAARVDELVAREREMDLRRENHERAQQLREQQTQAMTAAARSADELAALPEVDGDPAALATDVEEAQAAIAELSETLRSATMTRQDADRKLGELRSKLAAVDQAAEITTELEKLGTPDAQVDEARERDQELRGQRGEITAGRDHAVKHRDLLVSGGETAVCPTCRREFDGSVDDLVAAFDAEIEGYKVQVEGLDAEIAELGRRSKTLKGIADHARALRARLDALGVPEDADKLRADVTGAEETSRLAVDAEARQEANLDLRKQQLPGLVQRARAAKAGADRRRELDEQRSRAQREADLYTGELARISVNGYDPDAHTKLRTELNEAQEVARRCASLRTAAQSAQLIEGRVITEQEKVKELGDRCADLHAHADQVAVVDEVQEQAVERRDQVETELDEAQTALRVAERQATLDDEAVVAAQRRLDDGRKVQRRLKREHREWKWHEDVAAALSAYREDASRRARPTLEQETSLLLGQVTRGRYGAVQLTDSYLLKVADGRRLHPLKRFSGGEQDLASLCLRLALSRTLARQRGVEAGFIILDEVFSSQDLDRRRLVLGQLRELMEREFRQIFVVSHTDDVVEYCSMHIDVSCETGVSVATGPRA